MNLLREAPNWKEVYDANDMGFLPVGKKYSDLKVLVIGLNEPEAYQGSAKELGIIKRYWGDFFESMGVEEYSFVLLNSPMVSKLANDFINS